MRARFHRTLGAVAVLLTLTAGCAAVPRTEPIPAVARGDATESDAATSGPYPVAKGSSTATPYGSSAMDRT